jgi:selenocysteine-specific elongation factor
VRFHVGTAEVMGTLSLLDADAVEPGGWAARAGVLDEAVTAAWGQPFVLRGPSATQTLGGGQVLQPAAKKCGRRHLEVLEDRDVVVGRAGGAGSGSGVVWRGWWVHGRELVAAAALARRKRNAHPNFAGTGRLAEVAVGHGRQLLLHAEVLRDLDSRVLSVLDRLHEQFALMSSHDRQKVQSQLDYIGDDSLVHAAVDRLMQQKQVVGDLRR